MWFSKKKTQEQNTGQQDESKYTYAMDAEAYIGRDLILYSQKKQKEVFDSAVQRVPVNAAGVAMDAVGCGSFPATSVYSAANSAASAYLIYSSGFIGYNLCAYMAQHWLINKACSMKGKDAVRNGWELNFGDDKEVPPEVTARIKMLDRKFKVRQNLEQASRFNEIFGIRLVLFVVDGIDYEKPFNVDAMKAGTYRGISQIDPQWVTPAPTEKSLTEPAAINFYDPEYWLVKGKRYHKSHFAILRGEEVADILKPTYFYGGIPLTQRIYERVYAAERTANEAPELAMTKRLLVRKIDLPKAAGVDQKALSNKLNAQSQMRDNYQTLVTGKDEDINNLETSLGDLDSVIMTQYQLVSAIAKVPATKLLGTTPSGFQATGEHETKSYNQELETIQTNDLQEILEKHYTRLFKSKGINVGDFEIVWNPVDVKSALELSQINANNAATANTLYQTGAIDNYDIRAAIIEDKNSMFHGLEMPEDDEVLEAQAVNVNAGLVKNDIKTENSDII